MKLIIDISKEKYEWVCRNNLKSTEDTIIGMITHGTPIPDNVTNGDVIKVMFPSEYDFEEDFDESWWNAPYKEGGK